MKLINLSICLAISLSSCTSQGKIQPTTELSPESFANPPLEARPLALWDWLNGYVDTAKMVFELEQMKDKGMQGALIWDLGALIDPEKVIPEGPSFLGEKSLDYISLALKTSGRLGLNLGVLGSSSWNAGGSWIGEADASKQLLSIQQSVVGPAKQKIIIGTPVSRRGEVKTYSLVSSVAFPFSEAHEIDFSATKPIPLDAFTLDNKLIEWEVPDGKWEIVSFFMCNTDQPLTCPSPNSNGLMIDHLSLKATQAHFDTVMSRLASIGSPEHHIKFMELDSYEVWSAKDWTPGFIQAFKERYNYDPIPFLPLLQGYRSLDSIVGSRFLGDYSRLVSDLIIENHYSKAVDYGDENGIQMFIEAGHGGSPRVDPLKALGNSHIPMGEFWNRKRHWVTREAASAAHIYGKKVVASESLTGWNNWQHGPTDFKQLCDIAFCAGLNQIVFHTFAHNPEIAGKPGFVYHAGEHINVNTTWWEMVNPFMDYLSRCSYMLRQGNFVGDACLYYGDQAPNLVPSRRIDPNITPIFEEGHCLHCGEPKPVDSGELPGYDYDYINADVITTTLAAQEGRFVLPSGQSYRVLVLPQREDISLEVLKSLATLVYDGGVVIGPKPQRSTSLKNYPRCDQEILSIAGKMWGDCDGKSVLSNPYGKGTVYWGKTVKQVLEDLEIAADFEVTGIDNSDRHIDYIHRRTATEEIYFVSNSSQGTEKVSCVFRVEKNKIPEIWDAESGLVQRAVEYEKVKNGIRMELVMDPLASRFVVFRNQSTGKNDEALVGDLQYGFFTNTTSDEGLETIDISDNWAVRFNPEMGGPESYSFEKLSSWSDSDNEGIKYYSGSATYTREFMVSRETLSKQKEAFVVFGDIQEMARVSVNGQDCGILWTLPYRARITPYLKEGKNTLNVQVINTWNNRIVGDYKNPKGKVYTQTNAKNKFNENSPLLKSGLMGKAEIYITNGD